MAKRGESKGWSLILSAIKVYTKSRAFMCKPMNRVGRLVLSVAITGLLFPVDGADGKPDKKKSQAALQEGERADQAGRREEAIAAYTAAIEADGGNAAALR